MAGGFGGFWRGDGIGEDDAVAGGTGAFGASEKLRCSLPLLKADEGTLDLVMLHVSLDSFGFSS